MAPFGVLVIHRGMTKALQLGGHFTRMARVNPVITRRRIKERFRIGHVLLHVLVGRVGLDDLTILRNIRIAVFTHPAGASQQLVVTQHVKQRHRTDNSVEQVRTLHHHGTHQQTTVTATVDPKPARRGHTGVNQRFCDGNKVVVATLAVVLEGSLVPTRPELATATNVGDNVNPTVFKPKLAVGGVVVRLDRNFEPAVAIQHGRVASVELEALLVHDEVRNLLTVGTGGKPLMQLHARGIEPLRRALQFRLPARRKVIPVERCRRQRIAEREHEGVTLRIRIEHTDDALGRQRQRLATPSRTVLGKQQYLVDHVVTQANNETALHAGHVVKRRGIGRLPEKTRPTRGTVDHHQAPLRVGGTSGDHVRTEFDQDTVAHIGLHRCTLGDVQLVEGLCNAEAIVASHRGFEVRARRVEGVHDGITHHFAFRRVAHERSNHHVFSRGFADGFGFIQRLTTLDALQNTGITRIRERVFAEVRCREDGVLVFPAVAAFCLGEVKTTLLGGDELLLAEVIFTNDNGITAALRHLDQRTVVLQEERGTGINPVFVFLLGEFVHVEHGFPLEVGLLVVGQLAATQNTAYVLLAVLMEIPDVTVRHQRARQQTVGRGNDLLCVGLKASEAGIIFDTTSGQLRLGFCPRQSILAEDFLEPKKFISHVESPREKREKEKKKN